jgi:hypothetical protein
VRIFDEGTGKDGLTGSVGRLTESLFRRILPARAIAQLRTGSHFAIDINPQVGINFQSHSIQHA